MKSFMAKKTDVDSKWVLVDADGAVLGRMAAKIAPILMGKTKPIYTPHIDTGDYYTHVPGGRKFIGFADMMARKPEKVVELAVRRMLPKNKLGRKMLSKLKVYRGPEHPHKAQMPEKIEIG
jgi:large subunit ribosomal protein L13